MWFFMPHSASNSKTRGFQVSLFVLSILIGISSCTDTTPVFDVAPRIEFESIRREVPRAGYNEREIQSDFSGVSDEALLVTVRFEDGDGDIGGPTSILGQRTWVMRDIRVGLPSAFPYTTPGANPIIISDTSLTSGFLPDLGSGTRRPSITGSITYRVSSLEALPLDTCFVNTALRQRVRFEVFILDRSGNRSNSVTTDEVVIRCE